MFQRVKVNVNKAPVNFTIQAFQQHHRLQGHSKTSARHEMPPSKELERRIARLRARQSAYTVRQKGILLRYKSTFEHVATTNPDTRDEIQKSLDFGRKYADKVLAIFPELEAENLDSEETRMTALEGDLEEDRFSLASFEAHQDEFITMDYDPEINDTITTSELISIERKQLELGYNYKRILTLSENLLERSFVVADQVPTIDPQRLRLPAQEDMPTLEEMIGIESFVAGMVGQLFVERVNVENIAEEEQNVLNLEFTLQLCVRFYDVGVLVLEEQLERKRSEDLRLIPYSGYRAYVEKLLVEWNQHSKDWAPDMERLARLRM
ncbi:hypothetical protein BJ508DRAFT_313590 [Ascobolus immersus RN42]|uniref:Uncharacterized protein n=1 Tax=Ascobolus immersus RN42 TaxID=1160509 RepID=A0A3N4HNS5_ASCIM|nr:hypothetical protein BJ508DRAFT_313590 [Ascobolus immersus RN42]